MDVTPLPSHPSRLPQRPIWAPDPAVPLVARILAYLFAVLMLFTVIRSNMHVRPSDTLLYPQQWHRYSGKFCAVTYPSGWRVVDQSERSVSHVYFVYSTAGPSYVETVVQQSTEPMTPDMLQRLSETQEYQLGKKIPGYQSRTASDEDKALVGWHLFRASATESNTTPVVGAWVFYGQGNRTLFLLAVSSVANWPTMAEITATMLKHATL